MSGCQRAPAAAAADRSAESGVEQGCQLEAHVLPLLPAPSPSTTGLKFFTADGGLEKKDIAQILDSAAQLCIDHGVTLSESC